MHKGHRDVGTVVMDSKPKRRYPPELPWSEYLKAKRISRNRLLADYGILPTILEAKCVVMHIGGRDV